MSQCPDQAGLAETAEPSTWTAGRQPVPAEISGIRWADGTIECRWRIAHLEGSLVARDGDIGEVLVGDDVDCSTCSSACSS